MSLLTKILVFALVLTSMLLSAAAVTFVYTTPRYAGEVDRLQQLVDSTRTMADQKSQQASEQANTLQNSLREVQGQLAAAREQITALQSDVASAQAEVATAEAKVSQAQSAMSIAMTAVQETQAASSQMSQQLTDLRDQYENVVDRQSTTQQQLSRTQNELSYSQNALRRAEERNKDLLQQNDTQARAMAKAGLDPLNPERGGLLPPAINGVIDSRSDVDGVPYATISVGSEDDVAKGMQFNVLDGNTGDFLGFVEIFQTDDNQAFGRLSGPNIGQIKAGDNVRTQIRGS